VDRARLVLAKLLDERHALLQLRLALLELLNLRDDRMQPRRFGLCRGDVGVEPGRLLPERPITPADEAVAMRMQAMVTF
jgi:hypothetical protein